MLPVWNIYTYIYPKNHPVRSIYQHHGSHLGIISSSNGGSPQTQPGQALQRWPPRPRSRSRSRHWPGGCQVAGHVDCPLVNIPEKRWNITIFLMGKSTNQMVPRIWTTVDQNGQQAFPLPNQDTGHRSSSRGGGANDVMLPAPWTNIKAKCCDLNRKIYSLVNNKMQQNHGHLYTIYTLYTARTKWRFSIAMFVYQRVCGFWEMLLGFRAAGSS